MKVYYLLLILIAFTFVSTAEARTVKLSEFATPTDGEDDSLGFQNAIKRLKESGGGVLLVDEGTWDIRRPIDIYSNVRYSSIVIRGENDAVLDVRLGAYDTLFYAANLQRFEIRNLIFVGDRERQIDASRLIASHYVGQTIISGSQFSGVHTRESMIQFIHTSALVENCLFGGLATEGDMAVIEGRDYYTLDIRNSQFIDYAHYLDSVWSKTPWNSGAWIKAFHTNDDPPVNALGQGIMRVENSHFDEGVPYGIDLKNVDHFLAQGLVFNVQGSDIGTGIRFDNVAYGEVKMSKFGYSPNTRPALTILNNSRVKSIALKFGNGVYFADVDGSSTALIEECRECTAGLVAIRGLSESASSGTPIKKKK